MSVRVGVDVGGTFTKAIAFDTDAGAVVANAIVPTTHEHVDGVAAGVVDVVNQLAREVGPDRIELVTHSTTQAVNALLEGDGAKVGMIGMGRAPDLRKARKRTIGPRIELSEGRTLAMVPEFLDVTNGLSSEVARATIARVARGRRRGDRGRGGVRARRRRQRSDDQRGRDRGGPAGDHVGRAHRPLRARAAGRHRRAERVDPPDRAAHRRSGRRRGRGRRHHQPGDGHARRRRRH